jgi:hypothetical protein
MKKSGNKVQFVDYCALSQTEAKALADGSEKERLKNSESIKQCTPERVLKIEPLDILSELVCMIFLGFGVPNGVFSIPIGNPLNPNPNPYPNTNSNSNSNLNPNPNFTCPVPQRCLLSVILLVIFGTYSSIFSCQ